MQLLINKEGLHRYQKLSYPVRFGRYHELQWEDCTYHLALDGFPKFLQGRGGTWPHPLEWLKLSRAGDWAYYSAMGYHDLHELCGEYYYPFLAYGSNPIFDDNPLKTPVVQSLLGNHDLRCSKAGLLAQSAVDLSKEERDVLFLFSRWNSRIIARYAAKMHRIIKVNVPVLPPDCRHVDYDVIPVLVNEGCMANCGFCRVKTSSDFHQRSAAEVREQLVELKKHFGHELANYSDIFLGQHDVLGSGIEPLLNAIEETINILQPGQLITPPMFFLFASVPSFMQINDYDIIRLTAFPAKIFINVGIESFDQNTLHILRKPVTAEENRKAFARILKINRVHDNLNISVNLIDGNSVGHDHISATIDVLSHINRFDPYTTIYLSPLMNDFHRKGFLAHLQRLKSMGKLAVFPYLIQRL